MPVMTIIMAPSCPMFLTSDRSSGQTKRCATDGSRYTAVSNSGRQYPNGSCTTGVHRVFFTTDKNDWVEAW